MSNCYKNFPVIVNYSNSTSDTIYSNSASINENINIEHAKSLGVKGSNSVFTKTLVQGTLSVESYLSLGLKVFGEMKGANDQGISLQFGPYSCPAPCVLSSVSVSITVGEPITVSRSFSYFGGVNNVTAPTPSTPTIKPITPENITLHGFGQLGSISNIQSISWTFSQSYEEYYLLGERVPKIIFNQGQIQMDINGEGLANSLTVGNCVPSAKEYSIEVIDCEGVNMGSLAINGYAQSRSSSVSADNDEQNSVSIIQYL